MARLVLAALALAAALVAAGPRAAAAEEHVIHQKDKAFSQETIRVKRNDTIRFVNDDPFAHNVFSRSDVADFNVKLQEPGSSDAVRFDRKGVGLVHCAIHPKMKLQVVVEE